MNALNIVSVLFYLLMLTCVILALYGIFGSKKKLAGGLNTLFLKDHYIILGLTSLGFRIAREILINGNKVVVVSTFPNNTYADKIKSLGGKVLHSTAIDENLLKTARIEKSVKCIVTTDKDVDNIALANFISRFSGFSKSGNKLQVLLHISDWETKSLLSDYISRGQALQNIQVRIFDIDQEAARLIYDQFPPHLYVRDETFLNNKKSICVIGLNKTAEAFIIENSILSHYPGTPLLSIFVITRNAEEKVSDLLHRYPYLKNSLAVNAVELENAYFADTEHWKGDFVKHISVIDAAYCFGKEDAAIINTAVHFKQFLYNRTGNIRKVPIVVCLPEKTEVFDLLDADETKNKSTSVLKIFKDDLVIHTIRKFTDTCDAKRLIFNVDQIEYMAKVVNYFYSIKYEFNDLLNVHFKRNSNHQFLENLQSKFLHFNLRKNDPLLQLESLIISSIATYTKNSEFRVLKYFGIEQRWETISERNKESNRYVARDLEAKIYALKKLGAKELDIATIEKCLPKLGEHVHKKWVAEKMASHFAHGNLPTNDPKLKGLLKDVLKIHDLLVDYPQLNSHEKAKDKDMFLLIPVLIKVRDSVGD